MNERVSRVPSDRELRLIVGLTDGSLTPEEREAAESEVALVPESREALERQRRVVGRVRGVTPSAPDALRWRIDEQLTGTRRHRQPRRTLRVGLAGALGVVLAFALIALVGLRSDQPTVAEAATLGTRLAKGPAPPPDPTRPGLLKDAIGGVRFPDWEREFGWEATGTRTDYIDGRRAETVFYGHQGHRIAYTIVAGAPLEPPDHAWEAIVNGVQLHSFRNDPLDAHRKGLRDVVTFERGGMTCVLSGHVLRQSTLLMLASWRADGKVRF